MKCPHCQVAINDASSPILVGQYPSVKDGVSVASPSSEWYCRHQRCPECLNVIVHLTYTTSFDTRNPRTERILVYPRGALRPVPPEVEDPYRQDFIEAAMVLADSQKASAALSRRCLQSVLRDRAGVKPSNLFDEIEAVISSGAVPSHMAESLHAVRVIGNFAAHPIKSTSSGTVVDVEPGEAEWLLDVLESLFDFYFVQPAITARRKAELNKKLKEAGKVTIA